MAKSFAQNRKEDTSQNGRQRQAIPLCQVPQTKPEARDESSPLVLPKLPPKRMNQQLVDL